ncbi:DUF7932 domain-containing protein [Stieleria varia]|uniref:DUF7932 domain-containing protein n=1 Tax=Stieleria varia TaxID=2528005 RepID=A0A5C6B8A0_9BACT|nr:hypothetical protein [Stieleria varia]TWU07476.1 hypothetical protein Pla52n_00490 [Stieleria varia]
MSDRRYLTGEPDISDAGCFASSGETELLGVINLFGMDGPDGRDGESFHSPSPIPGVDGRRGGDATPAVPGESAGSAHVLLQYANNDRESGRFVFATELSARRQHQTLSDTASIGDQGYLFIDAHGGKGGNGGRGGDGGPGSVGKRGRDATRFSSGTNGGDGGHGGNAGEPTDGANGGDGGDVALTLSAQDLGLLMLVKGNLTAGDVGFAGEPGQGGQGGPGGRGGSSYSWTETESYTDSQGNRQTRTVFHSNPGGRDGRSGSDGAPSFYRAKDGFPGNIGTLRIIVIGANGRQTQYDSPYDLELVGFDVASEYSILEPDSLVSIDRIEIRNCGGMPTPPNYTVRVLLDSDRWLLREGDDLFLQQSLAPGESYIFENDGLRLRLADYVVDGPRRQWFRLHHDINPQARLESGINRPFRQFPNSQSVLVQFPVVIEAMTCLNSLAPGETTRVIWSVKNVGEETFDQKYLYRAVQSHLSLLDGDLDRSHIVFFDTNQKEHDLLQSDFRLPIGELRPGQSQIIETRIGVRDHDDIIAYQGFEFGVDLDLQRPKSSAAADQYRRVDCRSEMIRVSERYQRQVESRFLLIANEKTTTNDIDKWTQLADYFGSSLDVWDVSYYGFLDLMRRVANDQSLLQQWAGMTVIIPNNYYETPIGRTFALQQLAKTQFLKAAADHDINFYIVGDSRSGGEAALAASLIPVGEHNTPKTQQTRREFLRAVDRWNDYVARSQEVVGGVTGKAQEIADVSLGSVHEFDIQERTMLFQPKHKWLEQEAIKLQRKLTKEDPLHRWIVVHRYDTGDTDTSWGFFRRRQVGTLEARRTLDSSKGSAVLFEVDEIDAIDDDFINSQANKHGILLALRFQDKVDRFIRLVSERTFPRFSETYIDRPLTDEEVQQIGSELVETILNDLYNEQKTARECRIWGRWNVRALMPKLNYLAERSLNYGVTHQQMLDNEACMKLLFELVANLRYMALKSRTVWDLGVFPTAYFKRSRAVSNHMIQRTDRIITNLFGTEPSWWDKITGSGDDYDPFGNSRKRSPDGIERKVADEEIGRREKLLWLDKVPVENYASAQNHPGLTYDPELLSESQRVLSGKQFDALVAAERQAQQQRNETERAIHQERSDLLVPLRTAIAVEETQTSTSVATPTN